MLRLIVLASVFWAGGAIAADQPRYAPPSDWVKPLPIPPTVASTDGSAVQILVQDEQARFGSDGDEFYGAAAVRILSPTGLAGLANISRSWNPETETLIFHRLNIIRDGQTIDLLGGGKKVTVLRRETNLDLAMLDGGLTATVQPEGLRVGDVVDLAMTIVRHDPVFQGHSEANDALRFAGVAGRVHIRYIWPNATPIQWRASKGFPAPTVARSADNTELILDQTNLSAPKPPAGAPSRFLDVGELEFSQFPAWSDVSALVSPLYEKASTLSTTSPLKVEIERIRRASSDPKMRAQAALRLVQDQVHYVFLGMNSGGLVPADADLTWSRRFGDCKGKTALLLALLRALGVEAEPSLINTQNGDQLSGRLPQLGAFDHVFVRAVIGGKVYWLDGARLGDRDLDDIPIPNFHWTLPVQAHGATLTPLTPPPLTAPAFESLKRLDASAGFDQPAPAHAENLFRGDVAIAWHVLLDSVGKADADRALRQYWRQNASWIDVRTVDFAYDDAHHLMRLSMDGAATLDWTKNGASRDFDIGDSNLGYTANFKREPGPNADAPFVVDYPAYSQWTVAVTLPNGGSDFVTAGAGDVDTTIAGHRYLRRTRLERGVATMIAQDQSLTPEFPAAQADAAATALRALTSYNAVIRGPGASEPSNTMAEDAVEPPKDAAAFNRRGELSLRSRDFDHAIADFTEAMRLEPKNGKYAYDRGAAYFESRQDALAMKDFNQAIRLNPDDVLPWLARAELYLIEGDEPRARADFDQAQKIAPDDLSILKRRSFAYSRLGRFEEAARALAPLIAKVTDRGPRAQLLNERCWLRGQWGHELQQGLIDCNAALDLAPENPHFLDSRGFIQWRLGHYAEAKADYDTSLRLTATRPLWSSLFGRGLVERATGHDNVALADFKEARQAFPGVDAFFAKLGVTALSASKP